MAVRGARTATFEDPHGGVVDLAHRVLRTPGTPGGLLLRRPAADDARGPVRRPARLHRRPRGRRGDDRDGRRGSRSSPPSGSATSWSSWSARRTRAAGLTLLVETGLAEHVLPELPALALERDEHHRHKDVYEHTLTVLEQSIDLEHRLGGGARLRVPLRRAHARRRQAADPALRGRRRGDLPPPRRRRRQADPQADAGAALLQRRDRRGQHASSSCTCASTATARASGPTRRCAATCATPATSSSACTS